MSGIIKRFFIAAVVATVASGAAAQEQKEQQQKEQPSRSIVRLSYIPGNAALPMLVAIEHGMFAKEGLTVSAIPVTEETTIMRSLASGATDFAIGSQSVLLSVALNKVETRVVTMAGYGRDIQLVVPAWDTTTKRVADLKGKTVLLLNGVHHFDAVPELYRAIALQKPPLRLSDIRIHFVTLSNLQRIFEPTFRATYVKNKVGGLFMLREYTSRYVDDKKARVVATDEELTKLTGRLGAQPVFASKFIIDRDPRTVERFVRGWTRALGEIADPAMRPHVVRLLQIYYLRQHGGVLPKEMAELFIGVTKYDRSVWTDQDVAEVTINGKALHAARNLLFASIKDPNQRPFREVPDIKGFIDMSFAKKAVEDLAAERKAAAAKPPESPKPDAAKPEAAKPPMSEAPKQAEDKAAAEKPAPPAAAPPAAAPPAASPKQN